MWIATIAEMSTSPGPLPSWRDGPILRRLREFVADVTDETSSSFVPVDERVAVFDNDGTLWSERPLVQGAFVAQRLQQLVVDDPTLAGSQPWTAIAEGDTDWIDQAVARHYQGDSTDLKAFAAAALVGFSDITVEEFQSMAATYLASAVHPTLHRPFTSLGYAPMVELLGFLEAHGFTTYIVSGGGSDFIRPVTLAMYGIAPERVIGSSVGLRYAHDGANVRILRTDAIGVLNDGPEKVLQIWDRIGRRPILAGGNANGDVPMLAFTADQDRETLCVLIDHDDDQREFAYRSGAEEAVATAREMGWATVSMKDDWARVFTDR